MLRRPLAVLPMLYSFLSAHSGEYPCNICDLLRSMCGNFHGLKYIKASRPPALGEHAQTQANTVSFTVLSLLRMLDGTHTYIIYIIYLH